MGRFCAKRLEKSLLRSEGRGIFLLIVRLRPTSFATRTIEYCNRFTEHRNIALPSLFLGFLILSRTLTLKSIYNRSIFLTVLALTVLSHTTYIVTAIIVVIPLYRVIPRNFDIIWYRSGDSRASYYRT